MPMNARIANTVPPHIRPMRIPSFLLIRPAIMPANNAPMHNPTKEIALITTGGISIFVIKIASKNRTKIEMTIPIMLENAMVLINFNSPRFCEGFLDTKTLPLYHLPNDM